MENKEQMSFNSPEQMLDAILNGEKDLYNVKTGDYVFHYSESGSIAVSNLTSEEAEEIDKKAIENGEYWGAFLGGGEIWDDPERAAENEQDCNLDYCKKVYNLDGWVDVTVYPNKEKNIECNVIEEEINYISIIEGYQKYNKNMETKVERLEKQVMELRLLIPTEFPIEEIMDSCAMAAWKGCISGVERIFESLDGTVRLFFRGTVYEPMYEYFEAGCCVYYSENEMTDKKPLYTIDSRCIESYKNERVTTGSKEAIREYILLKNIGFREVKCEEI